ncbi:toxin-antitoxin system HicB family antitoxin [Lactiplantibacillus plantarum]|uniref:toxin-antitoxin system HicB family antitoxin n=1 Tax=Lactiplantibacillus plantarum TaxID=1590 RepID=UPI00325F6AFA
MDKNLNYFMSLNYDSVLKKITETDGEEYYRATVPLLPGVVAYGDTPEEVYQELDAAKKVWVEKCLADGIKIPEPISDTYSGRVTLRMPRELHEQLSIRAAENSVSLNSYLIALLSKDTELHAENDRLLNVISNTMEFGKKSLSEWKTRKILSGVRIASDNANDRFVSSRPDTNIVDFKEVETI